MRYVPMVRVTHGEVLDETIQWLKRMHLFHPRICSSLPSPAQTVRAVMQSKPPSNPRRVEAASHLSVSDLCSNDPLTSNFKDVTSCGGCQETYHQSVPLQQLAMAASTTSCAASLSAASCVSPPPQRRHGSSFKPPQRSGRPAATTLSASGNQRNLSYLDCTCMHYYCL